jgi:hypothetical protein
MDSFIESFEISSISKPFAKKIDKKRFFSSGNLAIENLIGILKNPRNPSKSKKIRKIHRNQVVSTPWKIQYKIYEFCENLS